MQVTCAPTSAEEHAVSTLMHPPCSPRLYEMRPHATFSALEVAVYALMPRWDDTARL